MKYLIQGALLATVAAPAFAAGDKPFFSLANTDFVVTIAFLLFIGVLVYFKVPPLLMGLLDKRAAGIQSELDEARKIKEEAQELLATYERKSREVEEQAKQIVEHARAEAEAAAEQAKKDIAIQMERRMQGAKDRIASAEAAAIREVKNRAADVAVAAAAEVIRGQMGDAERAKMVDDAIGTVKAKLH